MDAESALIEVDAADDAEPRLDLRNAHGSRREPLATKQEHPQLELSGRTLVWATVPVQCDTGRLVQSAAIGALHDRLWLAFVVDAGAQVVVSLVEVGLPNAG